MTEQTATTASREPMLVRAARYVLENGLAHVDNLTGCIVHEKKVERACNKQSRPTVYEQSELDDYDASKSEKLDETPLLIKRKKGGPNINPILLDTTTANMIVQVWEHLSDKQRGYDGMTKLLEKFAVSGAVTKLWKLIK